jgi:uncharacterized protein (DUF885 family)
MHEDITALADDLVALRFEQEPLMAAMMGIDEGPPGLGDRGRDAEEEYVRRYRHIAVGADEVRGRLSARGEPLDEREILTLDVVGESATSTADETELGLVEITVSDFFNSPLAGLVSILPQLPLDNALRRASYLERLEDVPRALDQIAQRHLEGIASGRFPTRRGVTNALTFIDAVISDPNLSGLRRPLGADETDVDFATAQDRILSELVVPSLLSYREVLHDMLLDRGRDDEHSGLDVLPGGAEIYSSLVRVWTSTRRTPEDLHGTGLSLIEELHRDFRTVAGRLWGLDDLASIFERIRDDSSLRYTTEQEILEAARSTVLRAEAVAPDWFDELPSTPCRVQAVPPALSEGSAAAYYHTGTLDGSRPGTYFVNTSQPEKRLRHMSEAVAFHEAVPGHHFQLTIAQEIADNHLVHSVFVDGANAEGWGLYSERLAQEMGLYSDDVALLGMLTSDAFRAARLVVDTGLHALGWSRQRAIDWMSDNVPISPLEVVAEVDRYISMPAQALSYMVGRLEIQECRRMATVALGARFDVRTFHNLVLLTGPVPLPALRAAVRRWIASYTSS